MIMEPFFKKIEHAGYWGQDLLLSQKVCRLKTNHDLYYSYLTPYTLDSTPYSKTHTEYLVLVSKPIPPATLSLRTLERHEAQCAMLCYSLEIRLVSLHPSDHWHQAL